MAEKAIAWARAKLVDAHGVTFTAAIEGTHGGKRRERIERGESEGLDATPVTSADQGGRDNVFPSSSQTGEGHVTATGTREASAEVRCKVESDKQGSLNQRVGTHDLEERDNTVEVQVQPEAMDAVSVRWWEGEDIRTIIVSIAEEEFVPDPGEEEAA